MKLKARIRQLQDAAQACRQRRLLVFSGERYWCLQQLGTLGLTDHGVWIGSDAPEGMERLDGKHAHRLLGRSISQLVVNGWDGLNPNAIGQASGALVGGGLLILLCPPLAEWCDYDDPEKAALAVYPWRADQVGGRFLRRLSRLINLEPDALVVREQGGCSGPKAFRPQPQRDLSLSLDTQQIVATADQQKAVKSILASVKNRNQPLVLTADRGRGKSAALGMAAAELLRMGRHVLVSAPSLQSVSEVFGFAASSLPDASERRGLLEWQQGVLQFLEPEQLLSSDIRGAVLLVDEAAAIPAPMLTAMLERFNRIVFSTTIHGYEGTGRGFAVRFRYQLDQKTPRWRSLHLDQPVRWAAEDPLEALVFKALLLDAEAAADDEVLESLPKPVVLEHVKQDLLLEDEALLRQLFGLLVLAHYRTTPGDLRILLDSPNVRVWCARQGRVVVGCALVADEGGLDPELADAIWGGTRRPPGHLLPQALTAQCGFQEASSQVAARVMRIAVHPTVRRKGLATQLLRAIAEDAGRRGLDYIGASFAATADLLPFWQRNGFDAVRVGQTRDSVSGAHACLVVQPLSSAGADLQSRLRRRFSEQLPLQLLGELARLEVELIPLLLLNIELLPPLSGQELSDLDGFAHHSRPLDISAFAIRKLALQLFSAGHKSDDREFHILLIQQLLPSGVQLAVGDRKWLHQQLREAVSEGLRLLPGRDPAD